MVRREDTWTQAADVLPRLCVRIFWIIIITTVVGGAVGFLYILFFQGKSFTFPMIPTSTPNSNAVKTEY